MILISYAYNARNCVACGQAFESEDDVVFCPICGAPHHRSCWKETGRCHFEETHGTDHEWSPSQQTEEPISKEQPVEQPTPKPTQNIFVVSGDVTMTRCPHCGGFTPCQNTPTACQHCGGEIIPPIGFQNTNPHSVVFAPGYLGEPDEAIDTATVGKLSRIVRQRKDYYIPRFKEMKSQGSKVISWNWSAFLLPTYWLAYRKCKLWAIFSSLVGLLMLLITSPVREQVAEILNTQLDADKMASSYEVLQILIAELEFSQTTALLCLGAGIIFLLRAVIFGLFGNYIYKKDCLKRVQQLDDMPKEEASIRVFKLSGVSLFSPIVFYYVVNILDTLINRLI